MPRVFGGEPFSQEDVAEMAAAIIAQDLRSSYVGVGQMFDSAFDLIVDAGPPEISGLFIFGAV